MEVCHHRMFLRKSAGTQCTKEVLRRLRLWSESSLFPLLCSCSSHLGGFPIVVRSITPQAFGPSLDGIFRMFKQVFGFAHAHRVPPSVF
jgi:hypothetical protein